MFAIQGLGGAEVCGDTVLDNLVLLENLIEDMQRTSAVDHVILRDDLEPADHRFFAQDVIVMRDAQTDPDSEIFKCIKKVGRHWKPEPLSLIRRADSP